MANSKRMSNEELAEIRKRAEKATCNPRLPGAEKWHDNANEYIVREDIPKLLAEIERLQSDIRFHKGYAERFAEEIAELQEELLDSYVFSEELRYEGVRDRE